MDFPESKEILHHFNLLLSEIDALLLLTMFSTYVIGKWPPTLQQLGYIQDAAGEVGGWPSQSVPATRVQIDSIKS